MTSVTCRMTAEAREQLRNSFRVWDYLTLPYLTEHKSCNQDVYAQNLSKAACRIAGRVSASGRFAPYPVLGSFALPQQSTRRSAPGLQWRFPSQASRPCRPTSTDIVWSFELEHVVSRPAVSYGFSRNMNVLHFRLIVYISGYEWKYKFSNHKTLAMSVV